MLSTNVLTLQVGMIKWKWITFKAYLYKYIII